MIKKIVSGGQTGADRAALDVAIELGIPHGGWIPMGRKTEDGRLPDEYRLLETTSIDYSQRTELNVVDSDGTLIVSHGSLTGGSALTQELARKHRQPCLHIDLDYVSNSKAAEIIGSWVDAREIKTLNVAGPRSSRDPKIYEAAKEVLRTVIRRYLPQTVEEAVESLISELPLKDKVATANMEEDELSALNLTIGAYIRRRFGLWSGNQDLLASCRTVSGNKNLHEDDASAVIIRELWKQLRETHGLRSVK
ncbi:MAG: putative molybdenum carrier protein [Candidatus Omnitrophota bacterium]|nr:MAG: putative molybdenum carrier protein [Candidatus Omnitrophota bacterium]